MSKITVEYIDHMGTDLTPVNAARVSMAKWKNDFDENDEKLLSYLEKHQHISPFFHAAAQFRVEVPIFVERQIFKHSIGFSYNSVSLRYVEPPNEFYSFDVFRKGSASIKQGSLPEPAPTQPALQSIYKFQCETAFETYRWLVSQGVCKEQARSVLPLSTMTTFIVTGSLGAFARMYNLRSKPDSQAETREYARQISQHMVELFPVAWPLLTKQSISEEK